MAARLRDRALLAQVTLANRVDAVRRQLTARLDRLRRDEAGQTPTEYLMIVGLMAVVIITVFIVMFWPAVKTAAGTWIGNVKKGITGGGIS